MTQVLTAACRKPWMGALPPAASNTHAIPMACPHEHVSCKRPDGIQVYQGLQQGRAPVRGPSLGVTLSHTVSESDIQRVDPAWV
eukprot:365562-Chlamydomonas_euryale.AAC.8